ncbi:glycosyltransferase family 4 protein [Muricauda sp. SK9]|nr:glycosyltransferase family 4 protein [Muricauda sp. SK9]MDC6385466.1 glycosyltransferase family 4 protein [Muricauda sp. SK9]
MEIQLAKSMQDMGSFSFGKIANAGMIVLKLVRKLILNKYDLVYLTLSPLGFAFYKDVILITILKLFNQKILFHLHGKGIRDELNSSFKRKMYRYVFKNAEIIHLAKSLTMDIKPVYSKEPHILANGIPKISMDSQRKGRHKVRFVYLSNLMKDKGILLFVEAITKLKGYSDQFEVYIIGPSADVKLEDIKDHLIKNEINNVRVIGPAYGPDKHNFLFKSDVFVLPTFYKNECFPITILEAFQAGLAVISSNNGAIPDMVENGVNGFLVSTESPEELADKMLYLINNREVLEKMRSNNKQEYKNKYTEEIFIDNFLKILDEVLNKKNVNSTI